MQLTSQKTQEEEGCGSSQGRSSDSLHEPELTGQRVQLMTSVRGQTLIDEAVDSDIFKDMTFCTFLAQDDADADEVDVIKGDSHNNKAALEALVHKHGGDFTQAQLSDNSAMVIAPDEKGKSLFALLRPELIYRSTM